MTSFKDNFSTQAAVYARYRPTYPDELYSYLGSLVNEHDLAWDCGTGNGQAAVALAGLFRKVVATDPSQQQIDNACAHPQVEYRVEPAEHSSLQMGSADIITIANALHWFSFDAFYTEARRVLRPGGIIAAWAYGVPALSPAVDEITSHYHNEVLGSYWRPENRLVDGSYEDLPFPFAREASPDFYATREMLPADLAGYLSTWSATQRYIARNGNDPLSDLHALLVNAWGDARRPITARWKLVMRIGRV